MANAVPGSVRVVFLRPAAVDHWASIGFSPELSATAGVLNTFPTRVKVGAGVVLGLHVSGAGMACFGPGTGSGDDQAGRKVFDPVLESDFTPATTLNNARVDLAVTLEPDADNDGYGDVTQDRCPTSDLTHESCDRVTVPDTSFTKKPAKRGTRKRIRAAFASTVPGSTFECSLDQQPMKPCPSPYRRKVGYGKHLLEVQAVGPAGVVDQSPASVVFRVLRKPH